MSIWECDTDVHDKSCTSLRKRRRARACKMIVARLDGFQVRQIRLSRRVSASHVCAGCGSGAIIGVRFLELVPVFRIVVSRRVMRQSNAGVVGLWLDAVQFYIFTVHQVQRVQRGTNVVVASVAVGFNDSGVGKIATTGCTP